MVTPRKSSSAGASASFESAWAELARDLCNVLVGDGAPKVLAEDVVQETGIRLFTRWAELDTSRSLMPLAVTIARNLVVDHHRKHDRVELQAFPQQDRAPLDVEQRALARVHLGAVHRSLHKISPRYRRLLLVEAGYLPDDEARDASARAARARARRGLNLLMDRLPDAAWGFVSPLVRLGRHWSNRLRHFGSRGDWTALGNAVAGLGLFLASLPSPEVGNQDAQLAPLPPPLSIASAASPRSPIVLGPPRASLTQRAPGSGASVPSGTELDDRPTDSSEGGPSSLLPPPAQSRGTTSSGSEFGLHGLTEDGGGSGTIGGEPAEWGYHVRYRNPECVTSAVEGDPSLGCEATPRARARASLRYADRDVSVDSSQH